MLFLIREGLSIWMSWFLECHCSWFDWIFANTELLTQANVPVKYMREHHLPLFPLQKVRGHQPSFYGLRMDIFTLQLRYDTVPMSVVFNSRTKGLNSRRADSTQNESHEMCLFIVHKWYNNGRSRGGNWHLTYHLYFVWFNRGHTLLSRSIQSIHRTKRCTRRTNKSTGFDCAEMVWFKMAENISWFV